MANDAELRMFGDQSYDTIISKLLSENGLEVTAIQSDETYTLDATDGLLYRVNKLPEIVRDAPEEDKVILLSLYNGGLTFYKNLAAGVNVAFCEWLAAVAWANSYYGFWVKKRDSSDNYIREVEADDDLAAKLSALPDQVVHKQYPKYLEQVPMVVVLIVAAKINVLKTGHHLALSNERALTGLLRNSMVVAAKAGGSFGNYFPNIPINGAPATIKITDPVILRRLHLSVHTSSTGRVVYSIFNDVEYMKGQWEVYVSYVHALTEVRHFPIKVRAEVAKRTENICPSGSAFHIAMLKAADHVSRSIVAGLFFESLQRAAPVLRKWKKVMDEPLFYGPAACTYTTARPFPEPLSEADYSPLLVFVVVFEDGGSISKAASVSSKLQAAKERENELHTMATAAKAAARRGIASIEEMLKKELNKKKFHTRMETQRMLEAYYENDDYDEPTAEQHRDDDDDGSDAHVDKMEEEELPPARRLRSAAHPVAEPAPKRRRN